MKNAENNIGGKKLQWIIMCCWICCIHEHETTHWQAL